MRRPRVPSKGLYWKIVPFILAVLSLLLFLVSATLLGAWNAGWAPLLLLLLLSIETFFLPYALVPLVARLPSLLPWVHYDLDKEFGIDGPDRLAQRILLGAMIILPGLPVLSVYGQGPHSFVTIPTALLISGEGTALIFILIAAVLSVPSFGGEPLER